ncbi:hypothetical protein K504DRAFT_462852 [Pleomassaria siparia CBS 279.74]|uniref:SnoaL-like domain-containing protein n=1 Tax=Pleomassaria siparia CBS 279.74 TaxID=1314801 RepID=A0A6G1JVK4_9PLEO|nr:hypothetical protein K504DRAFT_462852 [Pleomassaria siparia CBS 279.74]
MSSNLNFTQSEIRLATAALATILFITPAIYYLRGTPAQEETRHVRTFRKYIRAYSTLRPQALTANASRDFTHVVLPSALQVPTRTLAPFKMHAGMIFSLFTDFQMIPQRSGRDESVHLCKETNTVIAHCKMGGKVNGSSDKGKILVEGGIREWWTECVLFVRMDEGGTRVVEVREFVNSARAEELKKRLDGIFED